MKKTAKTPPTKLMGKREEQAVIRSMSATTIWCIGLAVVVLAVTGSVAWLATEENRVNPVVARVDGIPLRVSHVDDAMWEFGLPAAEAVNFAALPVMFEREAERMGVPLEEFLWAIIDNDEEFAAFADFLPPPEYIVAAQHILVAWTSFDTPEETRQHADYLLARAHAGEDFESLVATYGDDPGMWDNPEGYTFVEGFMTDAFYEGTRALQIGQISPQPVYSTPHGYHIIRRVQPDYDNVLRPWERSEEIDRQVAVFDAFEARAEAADVQFTNAWSRFFE
jgi:parvulin-like peptidyl-prolyl isomerase